MMATTTKTTAKKTTTKPAAKAPAKAAAKPVEAVEPVEAEETPYYEMPGAQMLIPLEDLNAAQRARLLGRFNDLIEAENQFDAIADLIEYIAAGYTVNETEFLNATKGTAGFEWASDLVGAYMREVGKGKA